MRRLAPASSPHTHRDAPPPTPWTLTDLAQLVRFQAVGFVGIVVCFVGARHTHRWDTQLYWIVGAMAAMLLAGVGWAVWLLVATRALRERQRRLAEVTATLAPPTPVVAANTQLVTAAGMTRFHRAGCVFVEGRDLTTGSADAMQQRGLLPCAVCIG